MPYVHDWEVNKATDSSRCGGVGSRERVQGSALCFGRFFVFVLFVVGFPR